MNNGTQRKDKTMRTAIMYSIYATNINGRFLIATCANKQIADLIAARLCDTWGDLEVVQA
jgi:hypothetical protein